MKARASEAEVGLKEDMTIIGRKVTEAQRHKMLTTAKKFVEGMACCRQHFPDLDLTQFDDAFARGDYDDVVWNTSKPALTGRFWPWIKEACAAADAAAAAQAEAALKQEAEEAGLAAKKGVRGCQEGI